MSGRRTIVKVCGLTRLEDARVAIDAGADWLGFVLHGESPRAADPGRAAEILASLPRATGVAVMVGPDPDTALAIATRAGARRVQLHRVDPATWPADFPLEASFVVPVERSGTLAAAAPPTRHLLMLDTAHATLAGGTGETLPWDAVATLAATRAVMLAGGLAADNVALALDQVHPFGVDASSRLEQSPGVKDAEAVRRYVAAVREWDERNDTHR
jgi:phosphoribosylanthranilate isomerase